MSINNMAILLHESLIDENPHFDLLEILLKGFVIYVTYFLVYFKYLNSENTVYTMFYRA